VVALILYLPDGVLALNFRRLVAWRKNG